MSRLLNKRRRSERVALNDTNKRQCSKQLALTTRYSRKAFLDLSPEIRNTIYTLLSPSYMDGDGEFVQDAKWPWPCPMLALEYGTVAPISNLAKTCRQVREEILSHELSDRMMMICTANPARYWDHHLDALSKKHLNRLTLLTPGRYIGDLPSVDNSDGIRSPSVEWHPPNGPRIQFCAVYTDDKRISAHTQFCFMFDHWKNDQVPWFTANSIRQIRDVLAEIYSPSSNPLATKNSGIETLIQAVDRLSQLPLKSREDPECKVDEPQFQSIEYRFCILDEPRRVRIATTELWFEDFQRRFEPLDGFCGVECCDEYL